MDEIEFKQEFGKAMTQVLQMDVGPVRNVLVGILHMLQGMDERITEMQLEEPED